MSSRFASLALAGAVLLGTAHTAWAEWPPCGRGVTASFTSNVHSSITTDGAGGAIVAWMDGQFLSNIFAHHLLASGDVDPAWPGVGRSLLLDDLNSTGDNIINGGRIFPQIVSDGAGGAIVSWQELRDSDTEIDVLAQHVLASGVVDPAWPADGTALVKIVRNQQDQVMVPDGAGGAIVAWVDSRAGANEFDIFAQHVLATGVVDPRWPLNGRAVVDAAGAQTIPSIVEDGQGGAIISWQDDRPGSLGSDVYAQHILNSGVADPAWPVNGRALVTLAGEQGRTAILSDGAHGAIVAWSDGRVTNTSHVFAQHLLSSGIVDPVWPSNGRAISNAAPIESRPQAISDGVGGAILTWQALSGHLNVFAGHVKANGILDPLWPAAGKALSNVNRTQIGGDIVPDGAGGAIVAWEDSFDVVAQHVFSTGTLDPAYTDSFRVLCNLPSQQGDIALVATGGAGAIAAWTDTRNAPAGPDIFALQVLEAVTVDVPGSGPPAFSFALPRPNPARETLRCRFALSHGAQVRLAIFDAAGRQVRELVSGLRPEGEQTVAWDRRDDQGHAVHGGFYFARLEMDGNTLTRKVVTLE